MSTTLAQRREFLRAGVLAVGWTSATSPRLCGAIAGPAVASRVLLDSEALLWADQDDSRLGPATRMLVDAALQRGELFVSSVSFWEIFTLVRMKRVVMKPDISQWRRGLLDAGVRELGVDGIIGIAEDDQLDGEYFHGAKLSIKLRPLLNSSRDQLISTPPHLLASLIVASAIRLRGTMVTTDQDLLGWKSDEFELSRHDART